MADFADVFTYLLNEPFSLIKVSNRVILHVFPIL